MPITDFTRVTGLIQEFCSSSRLHEVLQELDSHKKISGWEGWIQVEFAHFLHVHKKSIIESDRECPYKLDKRKSKKRSRAHVDFCLRWKHTDKSLRIALEFKAKYKFDKCLCEMLKDWEKVEKIRGSADNIRDFYVVGFHALGEHTVEQVQAIVSEETGLRISRIFCHPIEKTPFAVTLF